MRDSAFRYNYIVYDESTDFHVRSGGTYEWVKFQNDKAKEKILSSKVYEKVIGLEGRNKVETIFNTPGMRINLLVISEHDIEILEIYGPQGIGMRELYSVDYIASPKLPIDCMIALSLDISIDAWTDIHYIYYPQIHHIHSWHDASARAAAYELEPSRTTLLCMAYPYLHRLLIENQTSTKNISCQMSTKDIASTLFHLGELYFWGGTETGIYVLEKGNTILLS